MEKTFDLAVYNRLKGGGHIAAEIDPSCDQYRRWVAIYKPQSAPINKNVPEHLYLIRDFELEKDKIGEFTGDEDLIMHNKKKYYVNSEEELFEKLKSENIDPGKFTSPWRCDYPL
ncbi:hypothetical protein [Chitinophaga sp. GbtcB8]|uniref:hypothetical protein n=1 Tax=Chitinophaga sp. GbtcB8 TaxID=2824753 RepID=UPI001C2FF1A2|nr:hypothetical protein [Chitinophaga sp. GbtcB8]